MTRGIAILIALASLSIAHQGFSKTMTVTGHLPRDLSQDYFDLEIKVTDISKTTPAAGEDLFKDRIRVWLTDLSNSASEYVPFETDPMIAQVPFTVRLNSQISQTPNSNSLTDFTYNVRISANTLGGLKNTLLPNNKSSTVLQVYYYEEKKPTPEAKLESKTISINTAIVKTPPANATAKGTHRAIVVKWTTPATATWSDGSTQTPSQVIAVAIEKSSTISSVPAYLYDSTSAADNDASEGACVYVRDSENCVQCSDPDRHYLNPTKLTQLSASGVFQSSASASSGEITINGLENGKSYDVFAFFTPGGLQRSGCKVATPSANTTWSEHNGEDEATLSDPKCFIATAAYGTALHKNLRPLRWFRDVVLKNSRPGAAFIDWYYEHGPAAAQIVAAHPALQIFTRAVLWLPVMFLSLWIPLLGHLPLTAQAIIFAIATLVALNCSTLLQRRLRRRTI
jgi:hypothetical protein